MSNSEIRICAVVERSAAPQPGTDFYEAERIVYENLLFIPQDILDKFLDRFYLICIRHDDDPARDRNYPRTMYQHLIRDDFKFAGHMPITAKLDRIPIYQRTLLPVEIFNDAIVFRYERHEEQDCVAIIRREPGDGDWFDTTVLKAFVGKRQNVNKAAKDFVATLHIQMYAKESGGAHEIWPQIQWVWNPGLRDPELDISHAEKV